MLNLFKKSTIPVQFIDVNTNEKIGEVKMREEQLPLSFSKTNSNAIAKQGMAGYKS